MAMALQERLQKILSAAGVASRRRAETLICEGRVSVNGRTITELGSKADPVRDHIKVDGKLISTFPRKIYVLLNKPRGVICTLSDPQGRTKVTDLVRVSEKIYPVGRLDYDTEGIILLTNDGEFARLISRAGDRFVKVYHVKVRSTPDDSTLDRLRDGIRLEGGAKLASLKIQPIRIANNSWYEVTLTQGKNRQIHRMFKKVGHPVMKLYRKRIGFLNDHGLPVGRYRFLNPVEVERIFAMDRKLSQKAVPMAKSSAL